MFSVSVSVNRQNSIPQLQLLSRRLNRIPARLLLLLIGRADLDPGEEDHDGECRVEHHLVVAEVLKVAVLVRIINSQALQHAYFTLRRTAYGYLPIRKAAVTAVASPARLLYRL